MAVAIHRFRVVIWLTLLLGGGQSHASDVVTFNEDIFPIFEQRCHECHRPRAMAPMSLLTYEEVRPWAAAIRTEVALKRMPPFHADGPTGYYKDDIRLTPAQIDTIIRWVDSGARRGDPANAPLPKDWEPVNWPLGEPDLVIEFPEVTPSGENRDDSWMLYSDYIFPEEIWYRGVQFRAGNDSAIHHAHILMVAPDESIPPGGKSRQKIEVMAHQPIETWLPGLVPSLLEEGHAVQIRKGYRMAIQVHFGPSAGAASERPSVGVYFANGTIDRSMAVLGAAATPPIDIPPHAANYSLSTTKSFDVSGTITHFRNHMHARGKSARILLHFPDGRSELIFDLPRFDYDWQRYYHLAEPIWVPAGTVAEFVGTWDNSAGNPLNPDPARRVRTGFRTSDEMFGTKLYYSPDVKLSKTYTVVHGRAVDSRDNAESGEWVVFWNRVVHRSVIEAAFSESPPPPE